MIRPALPTLILALILAAGPAGAAAGIVDGSYGDEAGCRYARTGEASGSDTFLLLTKDAVTTAASHCEFKDEGRQVGGAMTIASQCHEEGYTETTPYDLTLTPDNGGFTVSFPDGTRWGPIMRCAK